MTRKNIILDLDHTIICSEDYRHDILHKIQDCEFDFLNNYVTVARPFLQQFLDYIFEEYDVSIWTASSKNYASFIYDRFIKKHDRKLKILLFSAHCEISLKETGCSKSLSLLWDKWHLDGFNKENTIIIDDLDEIYDFQPENCIKIKEFHIKDINKDIELLKLTKQLKDNSL